MAFLLKVMPEAMTDGTIVVPRMKSARLDADDVGATVYIWLGDTGAGKSALDSRAILSGFSEIMVAQARDPSKRKHAYRLELAPVQSRITSPLTTDDLGPYRHVEDADGIDSLGRVDRDRNDKIIRLTGAEADVLAERF